MSLQRHLFCSSICRFVVFAVRSKTCLRRNYDYILTFSNGQVCVRFFDTLTSWLAIDCAIIHDGSLHRSSTLNYRIYQFESQLIVTHLWEQLREQKKIHLQNCINSIRLLRSRRVNSFRQRRRDIIVPVGLWRGFSVVVISLFPVAWWSLINEQQ